MTSAIPIEGELEIPAIQDLEEFRRWATAEDFPETGRIDFVAGRIEVDMSPEELHTHGKPKTELVIVLGERIRSRQLGELYTDRTRVSCPDADVSAEPDVVFISEEALDSGRVRLVPKSGGEEDRYVELEGAPDLIVEIVSDSSVRKDTKRLPKRYWQAGVREFWLVDCRREPLSFRIQQRGESGYEPAPANAESYQYSAVLNAWYKLERTRNQRGRWQYTLRTK